MADRDMVTDEELRRMIDDAARQVEEIMEGFDPDKFIKDAEKYIQGEKWDD